MTARASPSILSKGFIWFLSCFQREAQRFKSSNGSRVQGFSSVLSVKSVVKEEKMLSVVEHKMRGDHVKI